MNWRLAARLAWRDYRADARLSICAVLALTAVVAPLLVLFGLKFGLVTTLTERLEHDPFVREIIPLGGLRYDRAAIEALAARPDVAFAIPRTRQIAATADLYREGRRLNVEMLPTAEGDPLLAGQVLPAAIDEVVLSRSSAEKLGAVEGDVLVATFGRTLAGKPDFQQRSLKVVAVLPFSAFPRDALFARLELLESVEDYRDGAGTASGARIYPAFRLYARDLADVETLRLYFQARQQPVATQAEAIAQVATLSRNLTWVFWVIASLSLLGASAAVAASTLAAVARKQHELSVLRLLGLPSSGLMAFVVLQAFYTGALALALSFLLYGTAALGLNLLFQAAADEYACRLLFTHFLSATLATLSCCILAAAVGGWRAARLEASQGLRHV